VPIDAGVLAKVRQDVAKGHLHNFVASSRITRQDSSVGFPDLAEQQIKVLDAWENHHWIMVVKYRQAKISLCMVLATLGMVEFTEGIQGYCIAEKKETAETVWQRASIAYKKQPDAYRFPLETGTKATSKSITFRHGSQVHVLSGHGETPALGTSPDVLYVTEYPDMADHEKFNTTVMPAVDTRPNARVGFEHTPGTFQSIPHFMWLASLEGKGKFFPVFLEWFKDPTILPLKDGQVIPSDDLVPDNEELRLIEQMPGIQKHHLLFRRLALDGLYNQDTRLFDNKYPKDPYDGWITSTSPRMPEDAVRWMVGYAKPTRHGVENHFEAPVEDDRPYLITDDPAGFGESGDPSALKVWDVWERKEVVGYSGREDPLLHARRIMRLQRLFGAKRTLVVVESTKGECLSALLSMDCPNLYYHKNDPTRPGFPAGEAINADAFTDTVELCRKKEIHIRSLSTVHQLLAWDGKSRTKRTKTAEHTHHFDEAVSVRIAAYLFKRYNFPRKPVIRAYSAGMTGREYDMLFKRASRRRVLGVL
jgi:hypothetical protein